MVVKITTWNVNGLRTLKDIGLILKNLDSDVICIQETKLSRSQVDDKLAFVDGYSSQFVFPRHLAGYSGCATYCRENSRPFHAESGLNDETNSTDNWRETLNLVAEFSSSKNLLKELDSEGRCLITCHHIRVMKKIKSEKDAEDKTECSQNGQPLGQQGPPQERALSDTEDTIEMKYDSPDIEDDNPIRKLYIFNVYFPRLDVEKPGRDEFKDKFNRLIELKAHTFLQDPSSHVIIAGDLNISHRKIDHCDPSPDFDDDIYRKWLTSFLSPDDNDLRRHMIDSFRKLHPHAIEAFTCWNTQIRARETNFGTRIDYLLVDSGLSDHIKNVSILSSFMGSDHCPVAITLDNVEWIASPEYPSISTKLWPEFGCKKQMTLTSFLVKGASQISQTSQGPAKFSPQKKKVPPKTTKNSSKIKSKKISTSSNSSIKTFIKSANKNSENRVAQESDEPKERSETKDSDQPKEPTQHTQIEKTVDHIDVREESNGTEEPGELDEDKDEKSKGPYGGKGQKVSLFEKMMAGPPKPPLCSGHRMPCVMMTCGKQGRNYKKRFWTCPLPKGDPSKPNSCCKFFRWIS